MHFKKLTLAIALTALSACGWINDKPKGAGNFKNENLELSCLNTMPTQLETLFDGGYTFNEKDQAEQAQIWACLHKSLNVFSQYTTGAVDGVYTASEMQNFANFFLPKDRQFTDRLTSSIFRLKRAVLGGSDVEITRVEIASLIAKLDRFGEIIRPFSGYIGTLTHPESSKTPAQKRLASEAMNRFVMNLAELMGDSVNPVAWSDVLSFVTELDRFTRKDKATGLSAVREQLPLLQYFKLLVVGGDASAIERAKWRPIFQAISHFYNALFLTDNTSDLLEELSIEIDSTEAEQKVAVESITSLLKILKSDPTIHSRRSIDIISDSWAKVLIANAFLFPRSQGSLALKPFLDSPTLRILAGYIYDQVMEMRVSDIDDEKVQVLKENITTFIKQSSLANNRQLSNSPSFSYDAFKAYIPELKPLLKDPKIYDLILRGLDVLKTTSPVLVGKDSDLLTTRDLCEIIQKGTDLYLAWRKKTVEESIYQSLDIVLRAPSFYTVEETQINAAFDAIQKLLGTLELKFSVNWPKIQSYVKSGLNAKGLLFANSNALISSGELKQIQTLWAPFRKGLDLEKNLPDALLEASNQLRNGPFHTVEISELIPAIDQFLPSAYSLGQFKFTAEQWGLLKALLIGGSNHSVEKSEFSDIARVTATLLRGVYPSYKSLAKDYKMGINSPTFALAQAALQSLIDARSRSPRSMIATNDLVKFITLYLTQAGYTPQTKSVEKLIIGLNHQIFEGKKGNKPSTLPSTMSIEGLKTFIPLLENIKLSLSDVEQAFGSAQKSPLQKQELLAKLKRLEDQELVKQIQPLINGTTGLPLFSAPGKRNDLYYLDDLTYKAMISNVVFWAFPYYKVEKDSAQGAKALRLSHSDLVGLLDDLGDLIFELGMTFSNSPSEESATSRSQTINLFTQSGNGDNYIDAYETTEFLTMTFGGKKLLEITRANLVAACYPEVSNYQTVKVFSVACLNRTLFSPEFFAKTYAPVAPQLAEHYIELSLEQRETFRKASLTAAKVNWTETGSFDLTDLEVLVSVPYYAENIFEKLDANFDGVLNFTEAMSGFPTFCNEIKKAAGPSIKGSCEPGEYPGQVEAIYGHLLMKGAPPRGIKPGDSIWRKAVEAKNFLLWVRYWNRLYRDPAVRDIAPPQLKRIDLLSIISNLSTSITPMPETAND